MKNVFLTGATGFIGQRLIKAIDANVKVLSRKSQPNIETIVCDLETESIPENTLENVDTVFHLAGIAHDMGDAKKIEHLYRRINIKATVRLAELAVKSNVKRFVYVSSVKAAEKSSVRSIHNNEGVYGKSKREAELKLLDIVQDSGMHVSIIRPSLVYGPNLKGNLYLMMSGINKGWFPPLPETGNRRSMIHVDDLVHAILLVSEDKRANGEIFIATDGITYSSHEIYITMCNVLGKSIPRWSTPKIFFDVAGLFSPHIKDKINKLLGNEYYSSDKLEMLGFKAKKSLVNMNETDF
tara:strand:+ start:810 stop:1697 length:888 start_codon:yes stop_codon:yes gene_type:complete